MEAEVKYRGSARGDEPLHEKGIAEKAGTRERDMTAVSFPSHLF
jgi:hypothetical protein